MPSSPRRISFADCVLILNERVYAPAEDTYLMNRNLAVNKGDYVLDMGTGSGILGIRAAEDACRVVAVDINPFAVICARDNARANFLSEKMDFVRSNLFSSFRAGHKFDLIMFNAPYLPVEQSEDTTWLDSSWAGGADGRRTIDPFVLESPKYLCNTGRILLLQSTLSDLDKTTKMYKKQGLRTRIITEKDLPFFETLVLVEATFERPK